MTLTAYRLAKRRQTLDAQRTRLAKGLAFAVLLACPVLSHSMQELDEADLRGATGEGVAFLPENTYLLFRGAGSNEAASSLLTDRSKDTGYIHVLPVGPLSDQSLNNSIYGATTGKADLYLYGLAISRGDGDVNSRLSATAPTIRSWGSAGNPWLLKVQTDNSVQDFSTTDSVGKSVPYFTLEAPLYNAYTFSGSSVTGGGPATAGLGNSVDAYNLKLAYWADIFNRKWDVVEGAADQFDVGGASRQNRLRLQAIWDGLSINGTNIKMFQTLGGAVNSGGMSTSYNNTFGMAGLIRMNSGDGGSVRAPVYSETSTDNTVSNTGTVGAWTLLHGGWNSTLSNSQTSGNCNNGSSVTVSNNAGETGCQFMVQSGTRTDTKTRTVTKTSAWSTGSGLGDHVFRIGSQETTGSAVDLTSPAINGGSAPSFAANEGLFLYNLNINLPLGSLQQPLTAGLAADGRNLVLEVARIPDKAAAYNAIYTNYNDSADVIAKNCNVYSCGTATLAGYQGSSATHGSISIGTTVYDSATNTLRAYTGADAAGVSFGNLVAVQGTTQTNTGSTSTSANVTQARWIQRTSNTATTWVYMDQAVGSSRTGTANQWSYGGTVVGGLVKQDAVYSCCSGDRYDYPAANGTGYTWVHNSSTPGLCNDANCTYYGTIANRNWTVSDMKGLTWSTASNATLDTWLAGQGSAASTSLSANQAPGPALPVVAQPNLGAVNLGSAVIDGILIQHMKFTTTGL